MKKPLKISLLAIPAGLLLWGCYAGTHSDSYTSASTRRQVDPSGRKTEWGLDEAGKRHGWNCVYDAEGNLREKFLMIHGQWGGQYLEFEPTGELHYSTIDYWGILNVTTWRVGSIRYRTRYTWLPAFPGQLQFF